MDSTSGFVPFDDRNLAYRAVALVKERFGVQKGIHIGIRKNIPVAAGLAGGSSDAAATLKGLNRLWDLGLTVEEMAKLGLGLGSDVPFCVYGGTAIARGRGRDHPCGSAAALLGDFGQTSPRGVYGGSICSISIGAGRGTSPVGSNVESFGDRGILTVSVMN